MTSFVHLTLRVNFYFKIEELFRTKFRARATILSTTIVEQHFIRMKAEKEIYRRFDLFKVLNDYEKMFDEKLSSDQVSRIMTLIRMLEGTSTAINNGLVSKLRLKFIHFS